MWIRHRFFVSFALLAGCFTPESNADTGTATGSTGSSTSGSGSTTTEASETDATATTTSATSTPAESSSTAATAADTGSTSTTSAEETSESSSSSTGPSTTDPQGPYGDCEPESDCPANGVLGCAHADFGDVCLPDCNDEVPCPPSDGPTEPSCVSLIGGEHACVIICQNDAQCPAGLTCQSGFGTMDICAWPTEI